MICILAHRAAAALIRTDTKAWEAPEAVFNEELFIKNTFSHDLVSGNQLQGDLERWFDTSTVTSWGWIINRLSDNNNSERMSHTHKYSSKAVIKMFVMSGPSLRLLSAHFSYQFDGCNAQRREGGTVPPGIQKSENKGVPVRREEWALCVEGSAGLDEPPRCGPTLASAALRVPRLSEVRLYPHPEPDRAKCSCSAFNLKLWLPPQI